MSSNLGALPNLNVLGHSPRGLEVAGFKVPASMAAHNNAETPEAAGQRVKDEFDFFSGICDTHGSAELDNASYVTSEDVKHPAGSSATGPDAHVVHRTDVRVNDAEMHYVADVEYSQIDDGSLVKKVHDYGQREGRVEYVKPKEQHDDPGYQSSLGESYRNFEEGNVQTVETVKPQTNPNSGFQYTVVHSGAPSDSASSALDEMFIAR